MDWTSALVESVANVSDRISNTCTVIAIAYFLLNALALAKPLLLIAPQLEDESCVSVFIFTFYPFPFFGTQEVFSVLPDGWRGNL